MSETRKQTSPADQLAGAIFRGCVLEECDGLWLDRAKAVRMIEAHTEAALAAATKRAEEAEAALQNAIIEWTAKLDDSEDRWADAEKSRDRYNDMRVSALEEVAGCRDLIATLRTRIAGVEQSFAVRVQEYREKIEQLETDKAFYHDKWLNALEKVQGCRDLIATLRTRIAEVEQERDQYKASANVGAEFFHDIGKILAPEGERKSFTDADVKQWAAEAKTAEQENARLRRALATGTASLLRDRIDRYKMTLSQISRTGGPRDFYTEEKVEEMEKELAALLAQPAGAK